jgi:hypothetical protein
MRRSKRIWIFGGRARSDPSQHPAWAMFEQAVLLELQDGKEIRRLEFGGSDEDRRLGISVCFKAASVHGDYAYACTNTEILKISVESMEIIERWSHRLFNDLHHVAQIGDRIYVVSTGIDSILEFDMSMTFLRRIGVAKNQVFERYPEDTDFRLVPSTKPHESHPNFVAAWNGGVWATRFNEKDVKRLVKGESFVLSEAPVHDGIPMFRRVWFTTVKGSVVRLDPDTGDVTTFDLTKYYSRIRAIGWCRGILPVAEDQAIVGFTKLRPTKWEENVSWVPWAISEAKSVLKRPTRVAQFDLKRGVEMWSIDLSDYGMDAVFSINDPGK